jgi:hypothetical protein
MIFDHPGVCLSIKVGIQMLPMVDISMVASEADLDHYLSPNNVGNLVCLTFTKF